MIQENLEHIQKRLEQACLRVGRKKETIRLVAVTKTVPLNSILQSIDAGIVEIGESRVQQAQEKFQHLHALKPQVQWHMIGHLQSNKVNRAVEIFDLIQSVDSPALLKRINQRAQDLQKVQDCLMELKLSQEPTKTGILESECDSFFNLAQQLSNVRLLGCMCIAPYFENAQKTRPYFSKARQIFERYPGSILSMGMSQDFEIAIEEGSTMVRIGSALFGKRVYAQ